MVCEKSPKFLMTGAGLKPSRICLVLILSLMAMISSACTGTGANSETGPPRVALTPELKNLLGPDDGYAVALMYGADLNGSLDDCGCHAHPMGGLAWRMGYKEAFRALHQDVPALQIDAGHLFTSLVDGNGAPFPDTIEKNKWIMKGYQQSGFTVANLSYQETAYMPELFKKIGYDQRVKETPFIERLVTANLRANAPDLLQPKAYVIQEVSNKRTPKPLRIGFTGVTFGGAPSPNSGFVLDDPTESLKKVLAELHNKVDIVVVMAYAPTPDVEKLAQVPGIDILIGAQNGQGWAMEVKKIGTTSVVYTFGQTKQLGDLRVYLNPDGKVKEFKNHYVSLDKEIPKDPPSATLVADAKLAIETIQRQQSGTQGMLPAGPDVNSIPQVKVTPSPPK